MLLLESNVLSPSVTMIINVILHQRNLPKVYLDLHRPPVAGVSQCLNWQIDGGSWGSEVVIISGPSREVARSSRWWPRPSVSCPLQISPHCTTTPSSRTRIISSPCSCYDPSSTTSTSSCQPSVSSSPSRDGASEPSMQVRTLGWRLFHKLKHDLFSWEHTMHPFSTI